MINTTRKLYKTVLQIRSCNSTIDPSHLANYYRRINYFNSNILKDQTRWRDKGCEDYRKTNK